MILEVYGVNIEGQHIDFITALTADYDETSDFTNADQYRITIADEYSSLYEESTFYVDREDLNATSYECILEIIQPT